MSLPSATIEPKLSTDFAQESLLPSLDVNGADLKDYFALLKPRVMSLVIFTAFCAMLMVPSGIGSVHPLISFTGLLCIAVGAGASGCLNMWYDRDIDAVMRRTMNRPLPQGRVHPDEALAFGLILSFASILVMGLVVNWLAAGYLAFTIFFYAVIYTLWLKRSTPQNIVIGGLAGALPPVIAWAAMTGSTSVEAWILCGIIFIWTPPHFWALSLYRHQDYIDANVPMLPVVSGPWITKLNILAYSIVLLAISLFPLTIGMNSVVYGAVAAILGSIFLWLASRLLFTDESKKSMGLFFYSIFYLFFLFLTMTVDRLFFIGGI